MSTFRTPVGPQPSRVYWRRRLFVLLGIAAVIAVILLIVFRPGASDTASAPQPTEGAGTAEGTETPAPSPSAEPVEGGDCDPASIKLEALTDTNVYAAGQLPQLSFRITNTSGVSCTFNLGSTQQTYVITSGEEQYWSSRDCQTEPVDAPILLEPNLAQTSAALPWDRTRSSIDTCDQPGEPVPAGGATYNLTVTVGPVESGATSFILN